MSGRTDSAASSDDDLTLGDIQEQEMWEEHTRERVKQMREAPSAATRHPIEDLMPDPDRRDAALERIAAIVKYAHVIWPTYTAPRDPQYVAVLRLLSHGQDTKGAATALGISPRTVEGHLRRARAELSADTTVHAVAEALRQGIIE